MRFRTTLLLGDKTATGIRVPDDVVAALGAGKRPAVRVTINGYTYRSTVAVMDGTFMLPVSAEVRKNAAIAAGDELDVDIQLDTEPREVSVPADFAGALDADDAARHTFAALSYSQQRWFVLGIEEGKKAETRARRIGAAVARVREGRGVR